jgi:uncharacterized protein (DUF305 family)
MMYHYDSERPPRVNPFAHLAYTFDHFDCVSTFMRSMIPHHSIAINTATRASISDPRVRARDAGRGPRYG